MEPPPPSETNSLSVLAQQLRALLRKAPDSGWRGWRDLGGLLCRRDSWWAVAALMAAAFFVADGSTCEGRSDGFGGLACSAAVAQGVLVAAALAIVAFAQVASLERFRQERLIRIERVVSGLLKAREPAPSNWKFVRHYDSQLPSVVFTFRKTAWLPVPSNLLMEGDIVALVGGEPAPVKAIRIIPSDGIIIRSGEVVPKEIYQSNPDHSDFQDHSKSDEDIENDVKGKAKTIFRPVDAATASEYANTLPTGFGEADKAAGAGGLSICRVMETPMVDIVQKAIDEANRVKLSEAPHMLPLRRAHASMHILGAVVLLMSVALVANVLRYVYRPDDMGPIHLILGRLAIVSAAGIPVLMPLWEQGLEQWAIAKLIGLSQNLQELRSDVSRVSARVDKDERRTLKTKMGVSARLDVKFTRVLKLFWQLVKPLKDTYSFERSLGSLESFQMANMLQLPLKSAKLLETLARTTAFCCLDEQVVLDPTPTVEEIMLLQGENTATIVDLCDGPGNTVAFEGASWQRHLSSLKPLALACLLGTDSRLQGGLRQRPVNSRRVALAAGQKIDINSQASMEDLASQFQRRAIPRHLRKLAHAIGFRRPDSRHYALCGILRVMDDLPVPVEMTRSVLTWSLHRGRAQMTCILVEDRTAALSSAPHTPQEMPPASSDYEEEDLEDDESPTLDETQTPTEVEMKGSKSAPPTAASIRKSRRHSSGKIVELAHIDTNPAQLKRSDGTQTPHGTGLASAQGANGNGPNKILSPGANQTSTNIHGAHAPLSPATIEKSIVSIDGGSTSVATTLPTSPLPPMPATNVAATTPVSTAKPTSNTEIATTGASGVADTSSTHHHHHHHQSHHHHYHHYHFHHTQSQTQQPPQHVTDLGSTVSPSSTAPVNDPLPKVSPPVVSTSGHRRRQRKRNQTSSGTIAGPRNLHMFTFGDPGLVASCCVEHWSGEAIWPLTSQNRAAILSVEKQWTFEDFDSVAFAYTPVPSHLATRFPATPPQNIDPLHVYLAEDESGKVQGTAAASPAAVSSPFGGTSTQRGAGKCENSDLLRAEQAQLLKQLLPTQVFTGMVGAREKPRASLSGLIEDLDSAGIRFVYFSPRGARRSLVVADKMGLETDWNTAISLRALESDDGALDPPENSFRADWDVNAKLPHGIEEIRKHIMEVDDVPLRVSTFTDSTPQSSREMIKILQENGEVVAAVGTGLCADNRLTFREADLAVTLQPKILLRHPVSHKQFLSTSSLSGPDAAEGLAAMRGAQPALCALELSSAISSLHSSIVLQSDASLSIVGDLIWEARLLTANYQQALLFMVSAHMLIAGTAALSYIFSIPDIIRPIELSWFLWIQAPLVGLPLLSTRRKRSFMHELPSRDDAQHLKYLAALARRYANYVFVRLAPSCAVLVLSYMWILADASDSPREAWRSFVWTESYVNVLSETEEELVHASMGFLLWWFLTLHAFTFFYRHDSTFQIPFNHAWFPCAFAALVFQIMYSTVYLHLHAGGEVSAIAWLSEAPVPFWITFSCWPVFIIGIAEATKRTERSLHLRNQRRLRVFFDTRLGMYSPK